MESRVIEIQKGLDDSSLCYVNQAAWDEAAQELLDKRIKEWGDDEVSECLGICRDDVERMMELCSRNRKEWYEAMLGRASMFWADDVDKYCVEQGMA